MRDRDYLMWLHARLEQQHGEKELVDFMHKLRAIISAIPADQETPNDGRGCNGLVELQGRLERIDRLRQEGLVRRWWRRFIERQRDALA